MRFAASRRARTRGTVFTALTAFAGAALLAACTVGPDYQRPQAEVPPEWHTDSFWRVAAPSHAPIAPDWWTGSLAYRTASLACRMGSLACWMGSAGWRSPDWR